MYIIGINPSITWTSTQTPDFRVGERGVDGNGNVYMFVKADAGGVTAGYAAVVTTADYVVDMVDTTNSAPGASNRMPVVVPQVAIPASGWGWGLIAGAGSVRVNALAAVGTRLNSTATAGQLDDDATGGSEVIEGIALTTVGGAAAGLAPAILNYPYTSNTL